MPVKQISVFLQSKPGHLKRILDTFESSQVSVKGYSASDTGDYGIVRFIVDNPTKALSVLQERGDAAVLSEVICLKLDDKPGELARVFGIINSLNMNIKYSYSLISTFIALSVDNIAQAEEALKQQPIELVNQEMLI